MSARIRLVAVAVDCADPRSLAEFYAALAGLEISFQDENFVRLTGAGVWLTIHRVPDHRPPTWPESTTPKQLHVDFAVDDLEAAEAHALSVGALKARMQPDPDHWRVMIDPAGHPFCLCTEWKEHADVLPAGLR